MKALTPEQYQTSNDRVNRRSELQLTSRYRWLLFILVLPLFIVISLLAYNQYRDERAQVLHTLSQNAYSYSIALDSIAKLASDHVLQMKAWSENYLISPPSYPSDLRQYYKPRFVDGKVDSYTLDQVPEDKRKFVGQLAWLGDDPRNPEVGETVLDQALEFFSLARLTHDVTPHFQWSYFFSGRKKLSAVYPWFSADDIIEASGYDSLKTALAVWYEYEIYTAGIPENNKDRQPYWTAPYIDAAGAGAMVSHGAPVYENNIFSGIVGTDVRLVTLEKFLRELPFEVGKLLIIDDKQMLLADSSDTLSDKIIKVNEKLPTDVTSDTIIEVSRSDEEYTETDSHVMSGNTVVHAPWTLIHLVSNDEIFQLLIPRLLPYAIILALLAATFIIALYILRKEFINPALLLVKYIHDSSSDITTPQPRLPRLWQTWTELISQTFINRDNASRLLKESKQRLQQILNNSSAVVYVRDIEERFLLVNQPFEKLLDTTQESVVGRRLDEIFPPETASEFRENDQLVIIENRVMEFEEYVTLEDGVHTYISNKFPLYDGNGDIYAICGISTDITKRKHAEQALHQAALGISEAKGNDVFDTLVMHISKALDVDFALIGLIEDNDRIRTRSLYAHGEIVKNISYELAGSPCENVVGQQMRYYPDDIQQRFPDDDLLVEIGMEGYAAIPLFDSTGDVLGLLAILHGHPLPDRELVESILQVFSGRASSELERERIDNELRDSESSYRAIFEASEACIFVHDIDTGAILDVNKRTCEEYGYSKDEMLNIDVGELSSGVPPYTLEDSAKLIQRAIAGEQLSFEWHRKNKDASLHWDEVFLRRASIGGKDRILAFTREITARKEAEENLRASELKYREANQQLRDSEAFKSAIVESALLSVITIDGSGRIVAFNPAAVEMFGYDERDALSNSVSELIIPESFRHAHEQGLERYQKTGESGVLGKRLELSAIRADGTEFPVELSISTAQVGDETYFTAFIADLTDKKEAELAIRASEEQYRSIFNAASDAMILWDAQGKMVDANPAAWEIGGYTRQEFFEKPFYEHIHPSSMAAFNNFKEEVAVNKTAFVETRAVGKDGKIIDLDSRSIAVPYHGQPHILTITRDITQQKQDAEELARQRDALRHSEKLSAMGELLAGVAHELNNPLAILMGRTALLEGKTRDLPIHDDINKIHTAADRCGRIVRTFLSMARQKPPECVPASLNDVINGAIDLLGYALRTSGIKLISNLAKGLPEPSMDADQIGQVIINLLVNAQHILDEKPQPRTIEVTTGHLDDGIYCRVTDNGPGVPDEVEQRIFDPFFTTKGESMGTGVGLSVSRSIAREHGGELRLENSSQGASFVLWLPIETSGTRPPIESGEITDTVFQAEHVLIVDDEPEIALLLTDILHSAGLNAKAVESGSAALQWLDNNRCDLILSDIRMPDMDGPAFWRELNENYPDMAKRTAFITGDTLSASINPFLKETGQPWLEKPFTPEQVLELIARIEIT